MKRSRVLAASVVGAIALVAAENGFSAERGWYVGAGYSTLSASYRPPLAFPTDVTGPVFLDGAVDAAEALVLVSYLGPDPIGSHGFKVTGGYRVLDWLSLETEYLGLDANSVSFDIFCVTQPCASGMRTETSSASASVLAMWPIKKLDLFARAGLTRWRSKIDGFNSDGSKFLAQHVYGNDEKFGAGAQLHFGNVVTRLEYERLRFSTISADSWSLGVVYEFR